MNTSEKKQAASITWFEIPADDVERAKRFYGDLFGWKIERFPGPQELKDFQDRRSIGILIPVAATILPMVRSRNVTARRSRLPTTLA